VSDFDQDRKPDSEGRRAGGDETAGKADDPRFTLRSQHPETVTGFQAGADEQPNLGDTQYVPRQLRPREDEPAPREHARPAEAQVGRLSLFVFDGVLIVHKGARYEGTLPADLQSDHWYCGSGRHADCGRIRRSCASPAIQSCG
jgi:hypothetical protein